jgi:hypothetical protein
MGEQIGTKLYGSTTSKQLFKTAIGPNDIIACVISGGQVQTIPMGAAMRNSGMPGIKKRYTNGESITGANGGTCILMQDVVTTATMGNVTADACRDGSVDSALVLDANGVVVDATFKASLPKVTFD